MRHKDARSMLPINPDNWDTLKKAIPGLNAAAKAVLRPTRFNATEPRVLQKDANYKYSKKLLKQQGLRLLTIEEMLFAISKDPSLRDRLRFKWAYIEGRCKEEKGLYTIESDFSLKKSDSAITKEEVMCSPGPHPLQFGVDHQQHGRLCLTGDLHPVSVAPLVIGVPISKPKPKIYFGVPF